MVRPVFPEVAGLHAPHGYAHVAVAPGSTIHVAGQVATDFSGRTVGLGDFAAQAAAAFANLLEALRAAHANAQSIVALTIYCDASVARSELRHLRTIWGPAGPPTPPPAITLVFVSGLLNPEWLIEIQAIAVEGPPAGRHTDQCA